MFKSCTAIFSCILLVAPTLTFAEESGDCGLLSFLGCSPKVSEEVEGLDQLSAQQIIAAFKAGSKYCNKPDFSNLSCSGVQKLQSVNADGISLSVVGGRAYSHKVRVLARLTIKDDLLCHSSSDHIATSTLYDTLDDKAEISPQDVIANSERQSSFRQNALAQVEANREFCFRYYFLEPLSEESNKEIVMDRYLDGVLQPFDEEETAAFFSDEASLRLLSRN